MAIGRRLSMPAVLYLAVALCCMVWTGHGGQASATLYGRGNYGSCKYQTCSALAPTVDTTSSGLQVAINLQNDQNIPTSSYTITITPLNGQGKSFMQATIYVDGEAAQTVKPDETGTASWVWQPTKTGSTTIKIVVSDTSGTSLIKSFNVRVVKADLGGSQSDSSSGGPVRQSTGQGLFEGVVNKGTLAVKNLPAPVVQSFPYLLFILLAMDAGLLMLQAAHELQEYHRLQSILGREQMVNETKNLFIELVSHYFRTPVMVLLGGIEMLENDTKVDSANRAEFAKTAQRVRTTMESLVEQSRAAAGKVPIPLPREAIGSYGCK